MVFNMITPELTKRIEEAAHKYWGDTAEMEDDPFIKGANFGYNLCAEEKDAEIEKLKEKNDYAEKAIALAEANFIKKNEKIATLESALAVACDSIGSLFDKIKHGDEQHQAWLKNAIDEHFATIAKLRGSL